MAKELTNREVVCNGSIKLKDIFDNGEPVFIHNEHGSITLDAKNGSVFLKGKNSLYADLNLRNVHWENVTATANFPRHSRTKANMGLPANALFTWYPVELVRIRRRNKYGKNYPFLVAGKIQAMKMFQDKPGAGCDIFTQNMIMSNQQLRGLWYPTQGDVDHSVTGIANAKTFPLPGSGWREQNGQFWYPATNNFVLKKESPDSFVLGYQLYYGAAEQYSRNILTEEDEAPVDEFIQYNDPLQINLCIQLSYSEGEDVVIEPLVPINASAEQLTN